MKGVGIKIPTPQLVEKVCPLAEFFDKLVFYYGKRNRRKHCRQRGLSSVRMHIVNNTSPVWLFVMGER